jgi:hypothetical protein
VSTQHTPTFKLFHYPIRVRCKYVDFKPDDYHEHYGVIKQESRSMTNHQYLEPVSTTRTSKELSDWAYDGTWFSLENPQDALSITEWINDYLSMWQKQVERGMNGLDETPLDRMHKFEELRTVLAPIHARVAPVPLEPVISQQLGSLLAGRVVRPVTPVVETQETPVTSSIPSVRIIEETLRRRGVRPK